MLQLQTHEGKCKAKGAIPPILEFFDRTLTERLGRRNANNFARSWKTWQNMVMRTAEGISRFWTLTLGTALYEFVQIVEIIVNLYVWSTERLCITLAGISIEGKLPRSAGRKWINLSWHFRTLATIWKGRIREAMLRAFYDHLKCTVILLLYIFKNVNTVLQQFTTPQKCFVVQGSVPFCFWVRQADYAHHWNLTGNVAGNVHVVLGFETHGQKVTLDWPENGVPAVWDHCTSLARSFTQAADVQRAEAVLFGLWTQPCPHS